MSGARTNPSPAKIVTSTPSLEQPLQGLNLNSGFHLSRGRFPSEMEGASESIKRFLQDLAFILSMETTGDRGSGCTATALLVDKKAMEMTVLVARNTATPTLLTGELEEGLSNILVRGSSTRARPLVERLLPEVIKHSQDRPSRYSKDYSQRSTMLDLSKDLCLLLKTVNPHFSPSIPKLEDENQEAYILSLYCHNVNDKSLSKEARKAWVAHTFYREHKVEYNSPQAVFHLTVGGVSRKVEKPWNNVSSYRNDNRNWLLLRYLHRMSQFRGSLLTVSEFLTSDEVQQDFKKLKFENIQAPHEKDLFVPQELGRNYNPSKKTAHCEIQIVNHVATKLRAKLNTISCTGKLKDPEMKIYNFIGCNMACCNNCWDFIREGTPFKMDSQHGNVYPGWSLPSGLRKIDRTRMNLRFCVGDLSPVSDGRV